MIAYDLIGQTPLVLLESFSDENVKIYAKLEQFNPGGSVKDRLGKYLVEKLLRTGVSKKVAPLLRLLLEILVLDLQLLRTGTRLNVSFMRRRAFPKKNFNYESIRCRCKAHT